MHLLAVPEHFEQSYHNRLLHTKGRLAHAKTTPAWVGPCRQKNVLVAAAQSEHGTLLLGNKIPGFLWLVYCFALYAMHSFPAADQPLAYTMLSQGA